MPIVDTPTATIGWIPVDVGAAPLSTWRNHAPTRPSVAREGAGPLERAGQVAMSGAIAVIVGAVIALLVALASDASTAGRVVLVAGSLLGVGLAGLLMTVAQPLMRSGSERGAIFQHRSRLADAQYARDVEAWQQQVVDDEARLKWEWEQLPRWRELRLAPPAASTRLADIIGGSREGAGTVIQHWAMREALSRRRVLILDLTRSPTTDELSEGATRPPIPPEWVDAVMWPRDGWTRDPFTGVRGGAALLAHLVSTLSKDQTRDMYPVMDFVSLVCGVLQQHGLEPTLPNVLRAVRSVRAPLPGASEPWPAVERSLQQRAPEFGQAWDEISALLLSMFNVILRRESEPPISERPATVWGTQSAPVTVVTLDPELPQAIRGDMAAILAECLRCVDVGVIGRFDRVFVLGVELLAQETAQQLSDALAEHAHVVFWMQSLPATYNQLGGSVENFIMLQMSNAAQASWMSEMLGTSEQFIVNSVSREWGRSYTHGVSETDEYSRSLSSNSGAGGRSSGQSETWGRSTGVNSSWSTSSGGGEVSALVERAVVRADTITTMQPTQLIVMNRRRQVVGADFHPNIPYEFITASIDGDPIPAGAVAGAAEAILQARSVGEAE